MLRFMLQDGVAEILVSFITQVRGPDDDEAERPEHGGPVTENLRKSYRQVLQASAHAGRCALRV